MFSDREALLSAIRATPDEDTPRLVFADWLDENGEAERAEFIRIQCELATTTDECAGSYAMYEFLRDRYSFGLPATDWSRVDAGVSRLIALAKRIEELLRQHGEEWLPKLPKRCAVEWDGFHRGFPHRVILRDADTMGTAADQLRESVPAVTLATRAFAPEFVEELAKTKLLGWIAGLETGSDSAAGLSEFGHRPDARNLRALTVRYDDAGAVVSALTGAPHFTGLRALNLSTTAINSQDAETLFGAKHLRTLRLLHLHGFNDWTVGTVRALTTNGFGELNSLHLAHCGLDDDAAEVLAACPDLARLRHLELAGNQFTGRGVTALLCSPHLANVAYLGLEENPCGGVDADRLAAAAPGGLRLFHAHGCRFRAADVRAIARCPRLRTVWYLDLDDNNLGTAAVRALVRGCKDWCPPILWLAYNRINDRGAGLLANWKAATGLSALHVKYNPPMTDAGVNALLDSPHMRNLDALGATVEGIETATRFRARFKHNDGY